MRGLRLEWVRDVHHRDTEAQRGDRAAASFIKDSNGSAPPDGRDSPFPSGSPLCLCVSVVNVSLPLRRELDACRGGAATDGALEGGDEPFQGLDLQGAEGADAETGLGR